MARENLAPLESLPLFIALPRALASHWCSTASVSDALAVHLGLRLRSENVRIFRMGATAGHVALQAGVMSARSGQPCVVAAADSLLSAQRLCDLSDQDRLLVDGNSDGIIPGEAAGAMMLTQDRRAAKARLLGFGLAEEAARLNNEVALRADGLVAATRNALDEAGLQLHELDFRIADAAGESFFFKELALLSARLLRGRKVQFPLWLPAEALGDTGAAGGLCGMLWAIAGWERGYAPGPRAVAFASDPDGDRAAALIEQTQ